MPDIAFDACTEGTPTSASSITVAHPFAGSNGIAEAFVYSDGDVITGVTVGGVAMTKVGSSIKNSVNNFYISAWIKAGPATGTQNVIASASGTVTLDMVVVSYSGASQTGQPDNNASNNTGTPQNFSDTVTPVADKCWVTSAFLRQGAGITGFSAGTARTSNQATTGLGVADTGPVTPAAATTITATSGASGSGWCSIVVSIKPAVFNPATGTGYMPIYPDILLDTTVEMVDSGFTPRAPEDPIDPTPN